MLKVMITGGSGFIGTNLIAGLVADNYRVLNLDKAAPINTAQTVHWKQLDILDAKALKKAALEFKPDYLIHLAAVTDLDGKNLQYYDANITGTQNVVDVAAQLPTLKKAIYTSSMYVCKPGYIPADYTTFKPHTLYGESKVATEKIVNATKNTAYEWVIIRPTSIWGPWFHVPYIDFFNVVYQGKYFDFGRACTKTYGYVGNTVFQIKKLMLSEGIHRRTFYLGDNPPIPISDWANEISIALGKGKVKSLPFVAVKAAALVGDVLQKLGIKFPMTSFRLSNMTTDNIFPLTDLYEVTGRTPFSRITGVKETIKWLIKHKGYKVNAGQNSPQLELAPTE